MDRDLVCGLIGFAVALLYLWAAGSIPESSLGDSVGAAGVPHVLGFVLAATSALFVVFRLVNLRQATSDAVLPGDGPFADPKAAFLSAAGTVLICAVFVFFFESAGYLLSVGLLILTLCMYQGERLNPRLAAIAAGGAFALWLLFAIVLNVRMPHGVWANLI
jgi:hypothetical protein